MTDRAEGVLIPASGNVVHNLRDAGARMRSGDVETPDWGRRFDDDVSNDLGEIKFLAGGIRLGIDFDAQ